VKADVADSLATNEAPTNRQENQWRCHFDGRVRIEARVAEICLRRAFATYGGRGVL
jgi:hypothetical protein